MMQTQPWASQTMDENGTIHWNGHEWPRDYQSDVLEVKHGTSVTAAQMHLSCGHWTKISHRVCPHCGRIIREAWHDE